MVRNGNDMDFPQRLVLYHGSRGGIDGDIAPASRNRCDFGKGFYMGTNADQAKSLISNDPDPVFYTLKLDIGNIPRENIIELSGMEWAFFVLYNRKKLEEIKGTALYSRCRDLAKGKDLIIGPIADDAMNETMNRFLKGDITDKAFLESIRAIDYGIQYVAKTEKACRCIGIMSERDLTGTELSEAVSLANERRTEGHRVAEEIQRKFRREGRYFDEILKSQKRTLKNDIGRGGR